MEILWNKKRTMLTKINGRITRVRPTKEKVFLGVHSDGGEYQVVLKKDFLEKREKNPKLGDIISILGIREEESWRGKPSIIAENYELLLRPEIYIPHDPNDSELIRARCSLDPIVREVLSSRGFIEVSSNNLSSSPGCSMVRPFKTQDIHGKNLYLRFTMDLELKRQATRLNSPVFELGNVFRNYRTDRKHSVLEYRLVEGCSPFMNLEEGIEIVKRIFLKSTKKFGIETVSPRCIDIEEACIEAHGGTVDPKNLKEIYVNRIKSREGPFFALSPPSSWSPLAESDQNRKALDAELIYRGVGCAHIYRSNTNYTQMKEIFDRQVLELKGLKRDAEVDEAYLNDLKRGIPPNVSFCISLDRLLMNFLGKDRTSEVVFH
jgi:lysyl-tRNA synthetase class II